MSLFTFRARLFSTHHSNYPLLSSCPHHISLSNFVMHVYQIQFDRVNNAQKKNNTRK